MRPSRLIWSMLILLLGVSGVALSVGSSDISLFRWLTGGATDPVARVILWDIRLPRVCIAVLVGASLSAAGALSQGIFRNPLASPTVLGTTSGGTVVGALWLYSGYPYSSIEIDWLGSYFLTPVFAFVGALGSTACVIGLSRMVSRGSLHIVLLVGIAVNALNGAIGSLILSLATKKTQQIPSILHWLLGSFAGKTWTHVLFLAPVCLLLLGCSLSIGRRLDLLALGEDYSAALGVNVARLKWTVIGLMAALVATALSVVGPLGFVGLIGPHVSRLLLGPANRLLMPMAAINGALLVVVADLAARTLWSPIEMEVGIVTGLFGGVFFMALVIRQLKADALC